MFYNIVMDTEMKRFYVIVEGRVQGVGFRGFCMMQAQTYHLCGSVRNLDNGMVEIYIQGMDQNIHSFLDALSKGDRWIRVDDISCKQVPLKTDEHRFSCLY